MITLEACLKPMCDGAWLVDLEQSEAIAFFVVRPGKHAGGLNFLCHQCLPRIIELNVAQQVRALHRQSKNLADGARGVGLDQPKPPSHT